MAEAANGVPANTNPFSVIQDREIGDGVLNDVAPQHFSWDVVQGTFAPLQVVTPALSQAEAEKLVKDLYEADEIGSFAVKEPFQHIIPTSLRSSVRVTDSKESTCGEGDTYFLEEEPDEA